MSAQRISYLRAQLENTQSDLSNLVERATTEDRPLTSDEETESEILRARSDRYIKELDTAVPAYERAQAALELAAKVTPAADGMNRAGAYAGMSNERKQYEDRGTNFIQDVVNARLHGDFMATGRLNRSDEEMRDIFRANDTTAVPGTLIPVYEPPVHLPLESGRPFLNTLRQRNLTASVVHVPTVNANITPDFQSTENSAFADITYGTTDQTFTTRTLGASYDVSIQSLAFSTISTEDVLVELQRGYNQKVEFQALQGAADAATGLLGIKNTSLFSPNISGSSVSDGETLYAKLGDAAAQLAANNPGVDGVPYFVMDRGTFYEFSFSLTTKHPLMANAYPQLGLGQTSVREVNGYKIVVSGNMAATSVAATPNGGTIIAYYPERVFFYEANGGNVASITDVISQAKTGTVRLVASNFVAFPGVRPDTRAAQLITNVPAFL